MRQLYIPGKSTIEVTLFAEFPSFYCSVVLLSPLNYLKVNFPRLIFVADGLIAMEKQDKGDTAKETQGHD